MRECSICHEPSLVFLDFQKNQSVCRQCRHPLGHLSKRERGLHARYKRKYGISYDEFLNRANGQGNLCAICKKKRRLVVDHDHKSTVVRGLLCQTCNSGLGMMMDSPLLLRIAATYVENSGTQKKVSPDEESPMRVAHANKILEEEYKSLSEKFKHAQNELRAIREGKGAYQRTDFVRAVVQGVLSIVENRRRPLSDERAERMSTWLNDVLKSL
jgi:hypothetical protein